MKLPDVQAKARNAQPDASRDRRGRWHESPQFGRRTMKNALLIVALAGILAGCDSPSAAPKVEVHRYENGVVSFKGCRDSDGKFHGEILSYWPSGQLAEQSHWDHGTLVSGKFCRETGVLCSEIKNGTGWRHCPGFSEYYWNGRYTHGAG